MPTRINAQSTKDTLQEKFASDAKFLKDASTLFTFATVAASGGQIGIAAGIALVLKCAGAAISSGVNITKRLGWPKPEAEIDVLPRYDRFRLLFFVACQRCYIEALCGVLKEVDVDQEEQKKAAPSRDDNANSQFQADLQTMLANLDEAEVSYLFGIEPIDKNVPLFDAFSEWLVRTLMFYGMNAHHARALAEECQKEARNRFRVTLADDDPASEWMRNYLAITHQDETSAKIADDLASIRAVLEDWTDPVTHMSARQSAAWEDYRKMLQRLPDLKDTMFNEQFGVRKVFQCPQVNYHISGASGDAGTPKLVSNLGNLIGALVSNRTAGDDPIILCGGPGSGKSTLCRVLASELSTRQDTHAVFLRLRRAKEGSEISFFIEESLQRQGLITQIPELREIKNLVLILDGFDELVMASRARLRHFFNVLREDLSTGPLRNAKAVVSGRDTLFPNGEGLPFGAHVLSLVAFDESRVRAWGAKWRKQHATGAGNTFHPESYLEKKKKKKGRLQKSPLHHLVTWPLTLHLVARVHTAGKLDVSGKGAKEIEKAYLYRSILAETATRQLEQAAGEGRLGPQKMREFLRTLSWTMYKNSVDSMDPSDVVPILSHFYPDAPEMDIAELAEVAVVNSPELTKGEETGFEFVHKSFSEFLVAEFLAAHIERASFKSKDFDSDEPTWRMSGNEAAMQLAPVIGIRLLTDEVQEMLEPMLGCLKPFLKGENVDDVVAGEERRDGLSRIIERFELLYQAFLRGESLDAVNEATRDRLLISSPLEAYANNCAGLLLIGTASARQLSTSRSGKRHFAAEPFVGAFWRCLSLLQAGGLTIDGRLASRLFSQLSVRVEDGEGSLSDASIPWKLKHLTLVDGYQSEIGRSVSDVVSAMKMLSQVTQLVAVLSPGNIMTSSRYFREDTDYDRNMGELWDRLFTRSIFERDSPLGQHVGLLMSAGICDEPSMYRDGSLFRSRETGMHFRERLDQLNHEMRSRNAELPQRYLDEYMHLVSREFESWRERGLRPNNEFEDVLYRIIREVFERFDYEMRRIR